MILIIGSIGGLIILGLGLLLRFKIARDEKNGIYANPPNDKTYHFSEDDVEGFPVSPFTGEYSVWEMSDEK